MWSHGGTGLTVAAWRVARGREQVAQVEAPARSDGVDGIEHLCLGMVYVDTADWIS